MDQRLVIVPAGAGAGKTHRIKTQLSNWVKRGVVRPERILAVTFTEAAAGELRERIRAGLLADGLVSEAMAVERAYVSTIHGLGLRLLTEHALAAGITLIQDRVVALESRSPQRLRLAQVRDSCPTPRSWSIWRPKARRFMTSASTTPPIRSLSPTAQTSCISLMPPRWATNMMSLSSGRARAGRSRRIISRRRVIRC